MAGPPPARATGGDACPGDEPGIPRPIRPTGRPTGRIIRTSCEPIPPNGPRIRVDNAARRVSGGSGHGCGGAGRPVARARRGIGCGRHAEARAGRPREWRRTGEADHGATGAARGRGEGGGGGGRAAVVSKGRPKGDGPGVSPGAVMWSRAACKPSSVLVLAQTALQDERRPFLWPRRCRRDRSRSSSGPPAACRPGRALTTGVATAAV